MKIQNAVFFLTLGIVGSLASVSSAWAENEGEAEKVIPTEISHPPYEVGNLVTEKGYYIKRGEAPSINFRIAENKIRIYWIDEDGLIAEPGFEVATVRFTGTQQARNYHRAELLPQKAGLGSPTIVPPPHTFNVVIVLGEEGDPDQETHAFRYVPAMNEEKDPTAKSSETADL